MEKNDSYRLHESRHKEQDASLRLQVRRERRMVHNLSCKTASEVRVRATDKVRQLAKVRQDVGAGLRASARLGKRLSARMRGCATGIGYKMKVVSARVSARLGVGARVSARLGVSARVSARLRVSARVSARLRVSARVSARLRASTRVSARLR
eukprot:scaffold16735_cov138-Skeletonema_menzelii.AAC.1